ncbi:MAG TPA: glycosyltransferase WbuB, partial [Acidimicrobiales bacterium]|nr:glycosyltransferase WbuB [Acidimicrobiales bacterium]
MRLLVVTPHFQPDTAPTGDVVALVVEALGRLGHESHVVTSLPWYADHAVADGWQGSPWRTGRHEHGTVTRLHPFPADKTSLVARSLGYLGFSGLTAA